MVSVGTDLADQGLRSYDWLLSYKTSTTVIDGRPVDILQDFYVPLLRCASRYDRVAGFFRSSSLAAASQGFSAFVGHQGKMRLIVGADLEPQDVTAILQGDSERLANALNRHLNQPESWPEGERNGVTLLAWMVAQGYLEVRVAFRVHGETGEPLTFDAVDDGYVHEKWFVVHDEFGNRLYGSGTLNESKTALVLNAENIDVHCDWWGKTDHIRVNEAAEAFENLWMNRVPHMPVMTLPEAVHRRLIEIAEGVNRPVEIDGTSAAPQSVNPPSAMELLKFYVLRDAPKMPNGRFVGMETAPVEAWPHQAMVVRRLVETWPYSYLLCDEVGLGKTIEAGLAFRSLYLSGLVKRILIAAPASLTRQWHRQMASKMLMSFGRVRSAVENIHEYIFPLEENRQSNSMYEPNLVIVSTGLLARSERAKGLAGAAPFDIALVDEAHAARRKNPGKGFRAHPEFGNLYVSVRDYLRPNARSLWLATATPMQIDPVEVCDLLALMNRVGSFQYDSTLTLQYYEVLGKLVHGQEPNKEEWEFLRKSIRSVQRHDPLHWRFIEHSVIDGRIRASVRQWIDHGRFPRGRDRELMNRLIFSASPLSRVMLRHTRGLLEVYRDKGQLQQNLARRHILPLPRISFNPLEQRIYDQLEHYCEELARQIRKNRDNHARQMMSFLLSFLRLRFASSLFALKETVQRRLRKVEATLRHQIRIADETEEETTSMYEWMQDEDEDDTIAVEALLKNRSQADLEWEREYLTSMLNSMADLAGPSSKMQELLKTLDRRRDRTTGRIRQTVIFTRFFDTLTDIVNRLQQADQRMLIGTYSGQTSAYFNPKTGEMISVDREEVKERFLRGEIDILVCTDAAAEGLNLQTADLLINFDLGWNPMKIEQRIGRIDRIGQKYPDISVLNLCYVDSAEATVYGRLLSRLIEANMIVGTQQLSLLPVGPDDFMELAEGRLTPEALEERARERIHILRQRTESMEIQPQHLYNIYLRAAGNQSKAPLDLSAIWETISGSQYLRDLGCVASEEDNKPIFKVFNVPGLPDGTIMTVSRDLYEEGLADSGTRVHFASYGDPFFDGLIKHVTAAFDLPGCIKRVSVPVQGFDDLEISAYAVICHGPNHTREVRLITKWSDLADLHLAEDSLTAAELEAIQNKLVQIARQEFDPYRAANRIERDNVRAARAQELLNLLVIRDLLKVKGGPTGEGALFWKVLGEIDQLIEKKERILVNELPAELLRPYSAELLFEPQIPSVGDKAHISAPRILLRSASDTAGRLAESMKTGKNELRVDTVLARIQREVENKRRQVQ